MKFILPFESIAKNLSRQAGGTSGVSVEQIAEDYITHCRAFAKRSTCSTYSTMLGRHILPEFGKEEIERLELEEISRFLYEKAYPQQGEGLSAGTIRLLVCVLRGLFRYGESRGLAVADWSAIRCPVQPAGETRVLDREEQLKLRQHLCCEPDHEKLGVLICLYTGLRIGEICALRWGDVDLVGGVLHIRRTVQRIRNLDWHEGCGQGRTKVIFDAPKSRSGMRSIPLPGFLLELLRSQSRNANCYILTGQAEQFMEPRTFQNHYRGILQSAGVEYVNFHALRHTFATNCVNLGFDAKALSEILGHSSVSITLNTYVHPSAALIRSYMERLR